ncbi:MAG: Rieske (2Fe-2S) protein [Planctomycetes bacterium]|nr:Rieske (2Fe-2S) protein [Planctomycetota bacterium]NOG56015.1 Rieske (2Fe-2S) protein [Planctomycetota bacterium]
MVPSNEDQPGAESGDLIGPDWHDLGLLSDIQIGHATYAEVAGRGVCVARASESDVVIFDDACPHAGASLAGGRVYDQCLVCPWHAWEFRLSDGKCPDNEVITVRKHECRVVDGHVLCRLNGTDSGPTDPRARF